MNRYLPFLLILVCGCATGKHEPWSSCVPSASLADGFTLSDPVSHQEYGPFAMTNGAKVTMGTNSFVFRLSDSQTGRLERELKTIRIPHLEFRKAALSDVFDFFSAVSQKVDYADESPPRITFIILGKGVGSLTTSLQLSDVSLFDAMTLVCDMHALIYRLDPRGVIFIMPRQNNQPVLED